MKYILELGHRECRWPVRDGEDGTLFCAEPTELGESYCDDHRGESVNRDVRPRPAPLAGAYGRPDARSRLYGSRRENTRLTRARAAEREPDLVELVEADS